MGMTIEAKVIAHSRPYWAEDGSSDLYTLQLRYPRFILAELNTHRMLSKSTSSSRAVPVKKLIENTINDPFIPEFGQNKPGMQAGDPLRPAILRDAKSDWLTALNDCVEAAESLIDLGAHKQWANRLLEPWSHVSTVITGTEWANFFKLRDHPDAQPEMQALARSMRVTMEASEPRVLQAGEWHLPYIREEERAEYILDEVRMASAARCARVSYLKHDGASPVVSDDLILANKLWNSGHMSPFEHQGVCWRRMVVPNPREGMTHRTNDGTIWSGNFCNWGQHRQLIEVGK